MGRDYLKIETKLIDERFPSVMGECEIVTLKVRPLYLTVYDSGLVRILPHFDLRIEENVARR